MHLLLKGVKITDVNSSHNHSVKDIRIKNGIITEIEAALDKQDDEQMADYTGKLISPGWFDMLASFADPGFEQKEDLASGANAASQGGFTSVCCMPNTNPALHSKAEIEYIINKNKNQLINIFPLGAVTKNREGKDLTEIYDMHNAGAVAFTDADTAIYDNGILLRSLQYVKPFNGLIINIPADHAIVGNAYLNEGIMSMQLGMYGIPDVLEELMVIRDIKLAEYAQSKIHIGCISSKKSVEHIRNAKQKGIQVSASVSAYQIYFDERVLHTYDANYKVNPPLRTRDDIDALIAGLCDGTIDTICSYHIPHESDAKDIEFEYAAFGMASLEAAFGAANFSLHKHLPLEKLIEKITANPRHHINGQSSKIEINAKAELTIFDAGIEWIFGQKNIKSKAKNNPFTGKKLKGKPVAVINNDQFKTLT